jgi:hypothetical protein
MGSIFFVCKNNPEHWFLEWVVNKVGNKNSNWGDHPGKAVNRNPMKKCFPVHPPSIPSGCTGACWFPPATSIMAESFWSWQSLRWNFVHRCQSIFARAPTSGEKFEYPVLVYVHFAKLKNFIRIRVLLMKFLLSFFTVGMCSLPLIRCAGICL